MVTVEHLHQNNSASPPHEQNTTTEQSIEMSQNQIVTQQEVNSNVEIDRSSAKIDKEAVKSAVSQRSVDLKISKKPNLTQEITRQVMKLDLVSTKDGDELDIMSPKSPVAGVRLSHQTSLTSSVDVEDRKTLREALYQGIFHRHRRTIFAVGSFLRMLRSRNSQYNTIRSSSEGEDINETR
ncbi:uncharacterized protein LOC129910982 isoform X2 [Episyrphus balteatus]|uniref:uncharacterized protein LOC129910982 isoform X2 n=1 Tax=Episyrphus balteatus TaxID=286459 RepID=UPI002486B38F|nr:uncharacterized protein LOC129910982 isoform X2 [Episyrphus balteatus]XP_055844578.1 uncharacterized protein LOC129910982 isoform X2 [Episyrphus balteatus]